MENTFKVAEGQDFRTITNNGKKNVDTNEEEARTANKGS